MNTEEELRTLLVAAGRFFDAAQRVYREQRPEDHAAYCTLIERGNAQPYISITLPPAVSVEIGVSRGDKRDAFFSWTPPVGKSN